MTTPSPNELNMRRAPWKPFAAGCFAGVGLTVIAAILGISAGAWYFQDWTAQRQAKGLTPPELPADRAADFSLRLRGLDGGELTLADFQGRAIFLQFWRPNCTACRAELPTVDELYRQLADVDVAFLAVAVADHGRVAETVAALDLALPVYLADLPVPAAYGLDGTPTTCIIAPGGAIAYRHAGAARWDAPEVAAYLRALALDPEAP